MIVTYYPAVDEGLGDAPRAAKILDIAKGRGVDPQHGLVTLVISGPIPGRGPFREKAAVPLFEGPDFYKTEKGEEPRSKRGCYDLSRAFEKAGGKLVDGAFEELDEARPQTAEELADLLAGERAKREELEARLAKLEEAQKPAGKAEKKE
jgi:BMFP domain-containing protein YqiC